MAKDHTAEEASDLSYALRAWQEQPLSLKAGEALVRPGTSRSSHFSHLNGKTLEAAGGIEPPYGALQAPA